MSVLYPEVLHKRTIWLIGIIGALWFVTFVSSASHVVYTSYALNPSPETGAMNVMSLVGGNRIQADFPRLSLDQYAVRSNNAALGRCCITASTQHQENKHRYLHSHPKIIRPT